MHDGRRHHGLLGDAHNVTPTRPRSCDAMAPQAHQCRRHDVAIACFELCPILPVDKGSSLQIVRGITSPPLTNCCNLIYLFLVIDDLGSLLKGILL